MKKLKGVLSIVLVVMLMFSAFSIPVSVNAATVEKADTALDVNLQNNIQDGVILHAFCWGYSEIEKNLEAIAAAGYTAIQTSPVQDPKDMNTSTDIAGQWWKLYQPVSFSISNNSWLGTKAQLASLCKAADKYGIKIICDIVSNHLGALTEGSSSNPYALAKEVKTFEPSIYGSNGATRNNPCFHQYFRNADDGSVQGVVEGMVSACPDLNSSNSTVQSRVTSLLKECIDCGVSGFRFDAAKHIETDTDGGSYANSKFWANVLGQATTYGKSKGRDIYYYGEILNGLGSGRNVSGYTKYMSITDNNVSASVRGGVTGHNANSTTSASYKAGSANKSVLWAESHDTYEGTSEKTQDISNEDLVKTWALVAARKDSTALFFPRPTGMSMGGSAKDTTYKSVAVAEANKFHNNFVGQSEKLGASGNFAYVARGNKGIVIVNTNGFGANASISGTGLADGAYKDMVTGANFTVSGGTVSGPVGSTGVAVVAQSTTTPKAFASEETQTFEGESLAVKLTLSNATSGTYQLENYAPVTFTGSPTIRIGSDYNYGETINLKLTATDGAQTTSITYHYTKKAAASSGVYVIFPASVIKSSKWKAPVYCYVYDEVTKAKNPTYKNASWPGEEMKYDATLDCYYIQVNNNNCLEQGATASNPSPSTFNLAASMNTMVIVNDSSSSSGGVSAGNQFPSANSKVTLKLEGKTHKFTALNQSGWTVSTDKPGHQTPVAATEVKKGSATVPTTVPTTATTAPPTTIPTTAPTTATTAPTTATTAPTTPPATIDPSTIVKYGDANLDGVININDVSVIQKHLADVAVLTDKGAKAADVDGAGLSIKDATYIQKYLVGISDSAKVGQAMDAEVQPTAPITQPTTQTTPPTQPTTQATEPITAPPTDPPVANTYTVYFKTTLAWMTAEMCSVYVCDTNSGESYQMEQDMSAYPNVFTAEVPETCSSVIFYRALGPVADPSSSTEAYNLMPATISATNNCYTLVDFPLAGEPVGSTGPYVAESAPEFQLTTIYFDNSKTNWSAVYVYGWGCGLVNNETLDMVQIPGTSIWKCDLPQPIPDGTEAFLFRSTPFSAGWAGTQQTKNVKVQAPNNCYVGGSDTWTTYNG